MHSTALTLPPVCHQSPQWAPLLPFPPHPQVIILPIAWHQRKEESARILAAAESAEQMLAAAGITSRIDDTDNYTPGQKMKYW